MRPIKTNNSKEKKVKICLSCNKVKLVSSEFFYRRKSSPDGFDSCCKECKRKQDKNYHRIRSYNITEENFNNLLEKQKNHCAICKIPLDFDNPYMLHIDHCHKSGKIRGLLCHHCNNILNFSSENPFILIKAMKYLKKFDIN